MPHQYREESDSLGTVQVPEDALYQAQTQRAVDNFPVSGLAMPGDFIAAVCRIKGVAAAVNAELGELEPEVAGAITRAADRVREGLSKGEYSDQFPVDVFQTGSGTSTNMNINEVLATLASRDLEAEVSPNDHVNRGQSSNDVIPTAIQVSAALAVKGALLPALEELADAIGRKSASLEAVVKTGRTHLMDAMPLTFGQELSAWETQVRDGMARLQDCLPRLCALPLGGTAVGTGINAHPDFAAACSRSLSAQTGLPFRMADNLFAGIASQDTAVELSGQLRVLAVSLMKISNDLRWMNSGPLAGLGEIALKALQPGSSIMPGKVNPVVPESVAMVCAQVMGNDATIAVAGQSGNFQLNVMLPVIAYNLLQSIDLLANSAGLLAQKAIATFEVNKANIDRALSLNPVLVTALNPVIGYSKAAEIAKAAYAEGRPIIDVADEMTELGREELTRLLDPRHLTNFG